jgi:hypothetical protein
MEDALHYLQDQLNTEKLGVIKLSTIPLDYNDLTGHPSGHNVAATQHIFSSGLFWSTNFLACSSAEARSHHIINTLEGLWNHLNLRKCSMKMQHGPLLNVPVGETASLQALPSTSALSHSLGGIRPRSAGCRTDNGTTWLQLDINSVLGFLSPQSTPVFPVGHAATAPAVHYLSFSCTRARSFSRKPNSDG